MERYEAYRKSQGRELLNVIPREGVRALLRHFRTDERAREAGEGEDLLVWLADRCGDILPLPPFDVWAQDFHRDRGAYAHVPGPPLAPQAPDGSPVTVELRSLSHGGQEWVAALALRPGDDQWVGHIRFHPGGAPGFFTTGEVFRESSPTEVRRRFQSFDEHTLGAFLRSALP